MGYRYTRNRYFQPQGNCSGQIFPVLLICLAGLLAAVGVTVAVGEKAKAKTSASNAADAGSLAAASFQAGAFNKLVDRNNDQKNTATVGDNFGQYMTKGDTYQYYKRMNYYFKEMRGHYEKLYTKAAEYLEEALKHSREAERLAKLALVQINIVGKDCKIWENQRAAVDLNVLAVDQVLEAAKCIGAFKICTEYMQKITDFFKDNQTKNFCEAKSFMQGEDGVGGAWLESRKAGQRYAFNNSAIISMLPEGLGDDFNLKLATDTLFGGPTAKYSWGPEDAKCFVSADLVLPKILVYGVKHTKWNYPKKHSLSAVPFSCNFGLAIPAANFENDPFNIDASLNLRENLRKVYEYFRTTLPEKGVAIYNQTVEGTNCCNAGQTCDKNIPSKCVDNCPNPERFFEKAKLLQVELAVGQACVIEGLRLINEDLTSQVSIPVLQKWNKDIFDKVWAEQAGDFPTVTTCEDVKNYLDGSEYPGMMVINIDNVTLSGEWNTQCTVTASCGKSTTISTSTSKFKGGDIGTFKDEYYPEIINAS